MRVYAIILILLSYGVSWGQTPGSLCGVNFTSSVATIDSAVVSKAYQLLKLEGRISLSHFTQEANRLHSFLTLEQVDMRGYERPDGDHWTTASNRDVLPSLRTTFSILYFAQIHGTSVKNLENQFMHFLKQTDFNKNKFAELDNNDPRFAEKLQDHLLGDFLGYLVRNTPNVNYPALQQVQFLSQL